VKNQPVDREIKLGEPVMTVPALLFEKKGLIPKVQQLLI
jgi:hypothetical protein